MKKSELQQIIKEEISKILNELKTYPKELVGAGEQGNVYPIGKDKVVKKIHNGWEPEEIKMYELFNQYPDLFPHVYKIGKDYVIMDKIDSPAKELTDATKFLHNNGWPYDDISDIDNLIRFNKLEIFNQMLQKAKESNKIEIYNTLKKCLEFFTELNKLFLSKLHKIVDGHIDSHSGNIGIDRRDGKIKIFDL
jgi:hypothetical protein